MAGAGAKLFADGNKLFAADVNTYLMDQSVMRFADAAARDAAFGGVAEPIVAEGMCCYLQSDKCIYIYNGTSWVRAVSSTPLKSVAVNRSLSAQNNFSNQTTYGDFPVTADATALQISFTKQYAETDLLVSIHAPLYFSSGVAQEKYLGLSIGGTDYDIATAYFLGAISTYSISGVRSISGISAGSKTVKPRFRTATASADQFLIGTRVSYSIAEVFA
jgi:hypothetical protein